MTPTEQDKELDLSRLKDVRAVLKWCYDHGLLKGEFPTSDSPGKIFVLDQGEKRLNQLITADRKRVELEARIDERLWPETVTLDINSSKEYTAGFNDALNQTIEANERRIVSLQAPTQKEKL